ncbi:hypothetical protein QL818_05815 [Bacillus altitudinis]|jgi:hypothetical protein|nr:MULTISPECIES: hypothetical protein [Bacillus]MCS3485577.1 hypothetical protein [Bacillus sp. JUb11]MDI6661185.1 hypothetical protein [Bacillus altitudinis]WHY06410.1 hypothetical protein QNH34_05075 [Bacillus altitudinis]
MCVIFAGGSIHYVRQLGYAGSYPPKHVLRQKAIVCAAGAGISLSILLLTLFLL